MTLSEIPTDIKINENNYTLVVAIEYVGEARNDEVGYYIAYCYRITGK